MSASRDKVQGHFFLKGLEVEHLLQLDSLALDFEQFFIQKEIYCNLIERSKGQEGQSTTDEIRRACDELGKIGFLIGEKIGDIVEPLKPMGIKKK